MKNLITILIFIFGTFYVSSQTSIFNKFEDLNDVSTVVVTQEAFKLMKNLGGNTPDAKEYRDLISGLSELKVFVTENNKIAMEMQSAFNNYISNGKLTELMRVKDKESNVSIYIKKGSKEDVVNELVMFVSDGNVLKKETVIMSLTGNIDLNKVYRLTEQMNVPGRSHLKNIKKN